MISSTVSLSHLGEFFESDLKKTKKFIKTQGLNSKLNGKNSRRKKHTAFKSSRLFNGFPQMIN